MTGCEHPTTSPSHIHNRVVAGLWSYFHSTARYRQAIEFFEPRKQDQGKGEKKKNLCVLIVFFPVAARDPEQTVFLAEAYRHLGEIPTGLCLLARVSHQLKTTEGNLIIGFVVLICGVFLGTDANAKVMGTVGEGGRAVGREWEDCSGTGSVENGSGCGVGIHTGVALVR